MDLIHTFAGYLGGIVCVLAMIVYIWAILKEKVSTNRVTWGIWTLVTLMLLIGYFRVLDTQEDSSKDSIWVSVAYFVSTTAVFLVLLAKKNLGVTEWTWVEKVCLGGTVLTLILWSIAQSSIMLLSLSMIVYILGFIILGIAVYENPKTEYAPAWWLGASANIINLFAIKTWDYEHVGYPIYMAAFTIVIATMASRTK